MGAAAGNLAVACDVRRIQRTDDAHFPFTMDVTKTGGLAMEEHASHGSAEIHEGSSWLENWWWLLLILFGIGCVIFLDTFPQAY